MKKIRKKCSTSFVINKNQNNNEKKKGRDQTNCNRKE